MKIYSIEEIKKMIASGKFHVNLGENSGITEDVVEDISKFINFVEEKHKKERSKNNER